MKILENQNLVTPFFVSHFPLSNFLEIFKYFAQINWFIAAESHQQKAVDTILLFYQSYQALEIIAHIKRFHGDRLNSNLFLIKIYIWSLSCQ